MFAALVRRMRAAQVRLAHSLGVRSGYSTAERAALAASVRDLESQVDRESMAQAQPSLFDAAEVIR